MHSTVVESRLNEHLNHELFSAYFYLSQAAYFESENLPGFASWMKIQAKEELMHAGKFFDYINQRDGRVTLGAIAAPKTTWESPLTALDDAYEHEKGVSRRINDLVGLVLQQGDHMTNAFLQWFVTEQVEEEANFKDVVSRLKLAGGGGQGLFLIDRELATRKSAEITDTAAE